MWPHPLANFFEANLGKSWANSGTQNWSKSTQNLGKIKILHPQKNSISYGYV